MQGVWKVVCRCPSRTRRPFAGPSRPSVHACTSSVHACTLRRKLTTTEYPAPPITVERKASAWPVTAINSDSLIVSPYRDSQSPSYRVLQFLRYSPLYTSPHPSLPKICATVLRVRSRLDGIRCAYTLGVRPGSGCPRYSASALTFSPGGSAVRRLERTERTRAEVREHVQPWLRIHRTCVLGPAPLHGHPALRVLPQGGPGSATIDVLAPCHVRFGVGRPLIAKPPLSVREALRLLRAVRTDLARAVAGPGAVALRLHLARLAVRAGPGHVPPVLGREPAGNHGG